MNTKLKCLLLDDEIPGLTFLKLICQEISNLEVVKAFNDPQAFLNEIHSLEYDFCILDIEMPKINGLEIAKHLTNKPVIFTTAYRDYALEAFNVNAIDYLQKPIQKERLEQAIIKITKFIQPTILKKEFTTINTNIGKYLLYFDAIEYISISSIDSRDKIVFLNTGKQVTIKNYSFEKLLLLLPKNDFCRINKKDVIALSQVDHFSLEEIVLKSNQKFQLSDVYRVDFIKKISI